MCKLQCGIALFVLTIGLVHSWDVAITSGNQLEFYTNKTKSNNLGAQFRDLTALAYDAVHNMLLFVDRQSDNASIFSYHLATKAYQSLVRRKSYDDIQGLTFDPVKRILFWTDTTEKSIYWISLKPGSQNQVYGNLLINMNDEIPRAIAVDSCRGYVYWTNTNITKPTIERARFDGSERKVIISTDIFMPVSLAIDQQTKRLYWADDKEGIHYSIESSDLDGGNREILVHGTMHQPNSLTVDKNSIYWVDFGFKTVWQLPKTAKEDVEPREYIVFSNNKPFSVVANYGVEEQTEGVLECADLRNLAKKSSSFNHTAVLNESYSVPPDVGLFCVHGVKVNGKLECKCATGYTGHRCDVSVCQNYCFQGDCSFTSDGKPTCRCTEGYSGERCEINLCHGYCLNNGFCSLNEDHRPVCSCYGDHEGARCELVKVITATEMTVTEANNNESIEAEKVVTTANVSASCNCTNDTNPSIYTKQSQDDFVQTCTDGWDSVRDPIIMVLGTLCGLLVLTCAVLITKILNLKKRPRIKKRIIVNKNVTPMTARPDQCEITIENCCNMNICETPCFEPRSTIRPTILDTKPGKEEKKNLIANMEYPDDY